MNVSIIKERIASPRKEYNPVSMSNTKQPAMVMIISVTRSAFPMSKLEYFFKTIAMMSVPPLDAPILNRMALPSAGRAMAKHSSNIG